MEIGYEEKYDILVLLFKDDYEYKTSIEVDSGFIVDIDKNNQIVGVEIIGCSDKIDKDKKYILNANIKGFIEVYEFSYKIIIDFNDGDCIIEKRLLKWFSFFILSMWIYVLFVWNFL